MKGRWKAWETESRFPTLPTGPWKSCQPREISTFPQPGFAPDGKVENQNQVSHFPARGSRPSPVSSFQNQKPRKEVGRAAASLSSLFRIPLYQKRDTVSCSSFNWKMLWTAAGSNERDGDFSST